MTLPVYEFPGRVGLTDAQDDRAGKAVFYSSNEPAEQLITQSLREKNV